MSLQTNYEIQTRAQDGQLKFYRCISKKELLDILGQLYTDKNIQEIWKISFDYPLNEKYTRLRFVRCAEHASWCKQNLGKFLEEYLNRIEPNKNIIMTPSEIICDQNLEDFISSEQASLAGEEICANSKNEIVIDHNDPANSLSLLSQILYFFSWRSFKFWCARTYQNLN